MVGAPGSAVSELATPPDEVRSIRVTLPSTPSTADVVFWTLSTIFAVWMVVQYRTWYFVVDDWTLFGTRLELLETNGYVDFFLRRHNEHLMAGMVLWDVALGKMFGLQSYLPWAITVAIGNVGVAWVCRRYLIRLGVGAVTAAASAPFVMIWAAFGSVAYWAPESIFAIITALAIGQFMLVEHDERPNRRDVFGAAAGVTAVLIHSSAVIFSPVIVGILLWRRRFLASTIAAAPAVVFCLWFVTYQQQPQVWKFRPSTDTVIPVDFHRDLATMLQFIGSMTSRLATNRSSIVLLILVVLVAAHGAAVAVRAGRARFVCFAIGSTVLYMCVLAWTRGHLSALLGLEPAGRYEAVVGLLILPLMVLSVQDLVRRFLPTRGWVRVTVGVTAFLGVLSLQVLDHAEHDREMMWFGHGMRDSVQDVAVRPDLDQMDGDAQVIDSWLMDLTIEDVRRLVRLGWLDTS